MHLGATLVAYRVREPWLTIVPWVEDHLIDGRSDELDEHQGLAKWWRDAERTWNANRSVATTLTLRVQIDYQSKLSKQFPVPEHRVVYTKSGQHLAASRIEDTTAVIDHKLYWAKARNPVVASFALVSASWPGREWRHDCGSFERAAVLGWNGLGPAADTDRRRRSRSA